MDGAGQKGIWSEIYSLAVSIGAVSGLGPADGATTTDTTPTLSWDEVPDAAGYEIQLADSKAGLETSPAQSAADTSYTPSSALVNEKTHYWRVRAVDGADQKGAWSAAYSLSVNIGTVSGLSPADGSTTWNTTPTFSWTEVPGAAGYEVRLADSQTGLDSASSVSEAGTSYTPTSTLTIGQTYYWEVRAKDGADQFGAWSDANSLRVESDVISGLSPADGSTTWNTTPTFSWTEVPGAAGYEVRLADSQTGLASASSVSEAGTSHTPTSALAIGQTHYWQVRAKDGADLFGPWSNANSLRVESDIVSGLSPADGSSTTDTAPTFSWTEVPGAVEYEVRIADSQNGLASALSARVTDNSHTPTSALTSGQTHYWQVRAKDGAGQFGAWSAAAAIQIDYSIGDTGPAGGSVFYDKGSYSDGWRYLEAAPSDQGTGIQWGGHGTKVGGTTTGIGTGKANTEAIVTELGGGNYVAKLCYDLKLGGYDDWFLPSKDELNELYKQKTTIGGSFSGAYWSSSEDSSNNAWLQNFNDGHQTALVKFYHVISVRAVRAF